MAESIIVDLTKGNAVVTAIQKDTSTTKLGPFKTFPWAVAFRIQNRQLLSFAGSQLCGTQEDDITILFDGLHEDLNRIEDAELQRRIIQTFWNALCDEAFDLQLLSTGGGGTKVFFITPYTYPAPLINSFRNACAQRNGFVLGGLVNETLAQVVGFLRSKHFSKELTQRTSADLCLLAATTSDEVTVAYIRYRKELTNARYTITISEFFRRSYRKLSSRLDGETLLTGCDLVVSLESPGLISLQRDALGAVLDHVSSERIVRHESEDVDSLKITGAASIAMCSLGRLKAAGEFIIEAPTNVGVQLTQNGICPVIHKDDLLGLSEFPYEARKPFRLRESSQRDVRINLYSGFSSRVTESVRLASIPVSIREPKSGRSPADLVVIVRMKTASEGEYTIEFPQDNHVFARGQFNLPGLIL